MSSKYELLEALDGIERLGAINKNLYEALGHLRNRFITAAAMAGLSPEYIQGELEETHKAMAKAEEK